MMENENVNSFPVMESGNVNKTGRLSGLLALAEQVIEHCGSEVNKDLEGYYDVLSQFQYIQDDPYYYKDLLKDYSIEPGYRGSLKGMLYLATETDLTAILMERLERQIKLTLEELHCTIAGYTDELTAL